MELLQAKQSIVLQENKKNNIINWKRFRHQEETPPSEFS
jgi:hypothetical protein